MPNERNTGRPSIPQRLAQSGRNFLTRQARGAMNTIPGTENWSPWQTLDAFVFPGNVYDSQAPAGQRWQVPGYDMMRDGFNTVRGWFNRPERGYTPAPGMGIMPNPAGWQPPMPQGEGVNIQPNIPGTLPQGQGPLRAYGNPAPLSPGLGARTNLNASNQARRHAEEMATLRALYGNFMPRGER